MLGFSTVIHQPVVFVLQITTYPMNRGTVHLITSLFLGNIIMFGNSASLRIISRQEWGGREPNGTWDKQSQTPQYIVVHHGGSKRYCTSQDECSSVIRAYQNYHMDHHGWGDIGYNALVGEDGNAYMGCGLDVIGAHAYKFNSKSIGICVVGDFTERPPNNEALTTLKELINYTVEKGYVKEDYKLIGHRQNPASPTECPGDKLYEVIKTWPHWASEIQ